MPPDAHDLVPSRPETCAGCGEPLGPGPWWMLEPGRGWHERCAPWEARPYPLADELRRLRSLRRKLAIAIDAIDAAGRALRALEQRWPEDATAILRAARARLDALEQRLRELGVRK